MLQLLGYDVRYVVDWADHVWCEVMLEGDDKPVHVDPCEAVVDEPLIYQNWGKNQTFIIAFPMTNQSQAVVDATSHYTTQYEASVQRRLKIHGESPESISEALRRVNARRNVD